MAVIVDMSRSDFQEHAVPLSAGYVLDSLQSTLIVIKDSGKYPGAQTLVCAREDGFLVVFENCDEEPVNGEQDVYLKYFQASRSSKTCKFYVVPVWVAEKYI
jgi:hypothetical protein